MVFGEPNSPFRSGGYLSFWSACYVGACTLLAGAFLETGPLVIPACAAFLIALQVYTMHRLRRATSHAASSTARSVFIVRHRRMMVATTAISGVAAAIVAWFVHPLAEIFVFGAPVGTILYAIGRRGMQVRDVMVLKNAMVGVSISVLSIGLVLLGSVDVPGWGPVLVVGLFLGGVVFVDAMLCDIDDIESDSITSTCTVPRFAGIGRTLATADVLACILTAGIIAGALAGLVRLEVAVVYSGLLLASLLVLNPLVPSGAWRNAMDLRLPMCVAGGWTIVILLTSRAPA
ncbi:MAG: hypothetical protein CMJ24_02780 [Phycisphaerae bacterium]|nr:hypothetical protein [Phycisphaerae bacterium]|tara:strand:- start:8061 stop:8927 length:867 start_codon:yes stop_codon:yes gene_type:complete